MDVFNEVFINSIKEINNKWVKKRNKNKFLSCKGMSNIYLKVTMEEKNWRSQNISFLGLESLSLGQFWGAPTHEYFIEF